MYDDHRSILSSCSTGAGNTSQLYTQISTRIRGMTIAPIFSHLSQFLSARQPGEPHHRPQLQHILLPDQDLVLRSELSSEPLAPLNILRTNKVTSNFDAVRQITDLMRTSSRDKYCLPGSLINPEAAYSVFFIQLLSLHRVKVERLRMNRIVLVLSAVMSFEETP